MSSERKSHGYPTTRKKKYLGACDLCRRRKVRCDSGQKMGVQCSNCIASGYECTHAELTKNPSSMKTYVETLEQRLEGMEQLLQKLVPGVDIEKEIEGNVTSQPEPPANNIPRNDDDEVTNSLDVKMRMLRVDPNAARFFGKSSDYYLIQQVINQRVSSSPENILQPFQRRLRNWNKRDEFWNPREWFLHRTSPTYPHHFFFPPADLIPQLVDLYFEVLNAYEPLLHRPTFQTGLDEGLHFQCPEFAMQVLLVCALGARFSNDERVFLDDRTDLPESAGVKWFNQVDLSRKDYYEKVSLLVIQCHILAVMFAETSGLVDGIYVSVGIAMRLAIDVGAHRRRDPGSKPTIKDELWKRAFWSLLIMNHTVSAYNGLPVTLSEDDYDQEYPAEVDDEYWSHDFKQPEGLPTTVSYYVHNIKLFEILARALEKNYKVKKAASSQETLSELDSTMNAWLANVPDHMRWDSSRPSRHAALTFTIFHYLQIFVHRPYIPTSKTQSPLSFPSLLIATSAARSIAKIIGTPAISEYGLHVPLSLMLLSAFSSGMILLLSTWSGKRAGLLAATGPDMRHVHECMRFLKNAETRVNWAGQLWDILSELAAAGDLTTATEHRYGTDDRHQGGWEFNDGSSPPQEGDDFCGGRQASEILEAAKARYSVPVALGLLPNPLQWEPPQMDMSTPSTSTLSSGSSPGVWMPPVPAEAIPQPEPSYSLETQHALENAMMQTRPISSFTSENALGEGNSMFYQQEQQQSQSQLQMNQADVNALYAAFPPLAMDNESMAMWNFSGSNGFPDDWGAYFTQMTEMTRHGHGHPTQDTGL